MPAFLAPLAISGISALAGLFGSKNQKQKQDQVTTDNINQQTNPIYDPQTEILKQILMERFLGANEEDADLEGYTIEGLKNINSGSDAAGLNIENILASRGLNRTSAGATSLVGNQVNRLNQQSSFLNQIPMLRRDLNRQSLGDLAGFFSSIPKGSSTTGTTTRRTTGDSTLYGNPLAGSFSSLATTLAGLYGQGAFGGPKKKA